MWNVMLGAPDTARTLVGCERRAELGTQSRQACAQAARYVAVCEASCPRSAPGPPLSASSAISPRAAFGTGGLNQKMQGDL